MSSLRSGLRYSRFLNQSSRSIGAPEFKKLRNLELEHSEPNSDFIDKL